MKISRKIIIASLFAVITFVPVYSVVLAQGTGTGVVTCDGPEGVGRVCDYKAFISTINNIIQKIIIFAASGAAILFAYAGFLYVTAQGDTGKISQAHKIFGNVGIGFIIILLAWLIVSLILKSLDANPEVGKFLQG